MGQSPLDPAFNELRPLNEDRVLGAKLALKPQQVWARRNVAWALAQRGYSGERAKLSV